MNDNSTNIPEVLIQARDRISKGLPADKSALWVEQFSAAISQCPNPSTVWRKFAASLLDDPVRGIVRTFVEPKQHVDVILEIAQLFRQDCRDETTWLSIEQSAISGADIFDLAFSLQQSRAQTAEEGAEPGAGPTTEDSLVPNILAVYFALLFAASAAEVEVKGSANAVIVDMYAITMATNAYRPDAHAIAAMAPRLEYTESPADTGELEQQPGSRLDTDPKATEAKLSAYVWMSEHLLECLEKAE